MIATHVVNPMYVATMGFISQDPINLATDGFINWTYDPITITGPTPVITGSINTYTAGPITIGSVYTWNVTGSYNIINTINNTITIQWFSSGVVSVIETNSGLNYIGSEVFYNVDIIEVNNISNIGGDDVDDEFFNYTPVTEFNKPLIFTNTNDLPEVSIEDINNSIKNIINEDIESNQEIFLEQTNELPSDNNFISVDKFIFDSEIIPNIYNNDILYFNIKHNINNKIKLINFNLVNKIKLNYFEIE